jgi:hypothetical protein
MKSHHRLMIACLFAVCMNTLPVSAQPAANEKTRVVMIGTIHGDHKTSTRYSLDVLRRVLIAIKPDQILTEIPPERVAQAFAGFRATGRVTEPRVSVFPEYVDVVFPLTRSQTFTLVGVAGWTQALSDERSAALNGLPLILRVARSGARISKPIQPMKGQLEIATTTHCLSIRPLMIYWLNARRRLINDFLTMTLAPARGHQSIRRITN